MFNHSVSLSLSFCVWALFFYSFIHFLSVYLTACLQCIIVRLNCCKSMNRVRRGVCFCLWASKKPFNCTFLFVGALSLHFKYSLFYTDARAPTHIHTRTAAFVIKAGGTHLRYCKIYLRITKTHKNEGERENWNQSRAAMKQTPRTP